MSVDGVFTLIMWRESVNEKRKARAIQRAIDKAYAKLDNLQKAILWMHLHGSKLKLSAW